MDQVQREKRWRETCRGFRDSDMTRKAFCEWRGIALSALGYWRTWLTVLVSDQRGGRYFSEESPAC